MSHLQPKFIAKTKASFKGSQKPRAMPRSMILSESTSISLGRRKRRPGEFGWYLNWKLVADYRIFSLKK